MANKNIGGDFSLLSILPFVGNNNDFFPASIGESKCRLFESGTDSICALILANWENNSMSIFSIWVPAHYCGQTLLRINKTLCNYGCKSKFRYYENGSDLYEQSFDKGDVVIWVHFNCFMSIPLQIKERLKDRGVYILEDFVLAPFDIQKMSGDAAVNSLRKITPLSLSITYSSQSLPIYSPSSDYNNERRIGAWKKSVFEINPKAPLEAEFLGRFHKAEKALEQRLTIHSASIEDEGLLRKIDWLKIIEIRIRNYRILFENLNSLDLNILPGEYQFLMLALSKRDAVRKTLFAKNVFPPIHWVDAQSTLARTQLSIPIDQRYSEEDMLHLAHLLRKILY